MLQSQAKLNEILSKYFEETKRTGRKRQGPQYAVECWRDIKVVLQNKLTKIKYKLRTNLAAEISKPIRSHITHKQFVHSREVIKSTISMIEMAFGLSCQADDSMTINNCNIAQLDAEDDSEHSFANEQERLAMTLTRVLYDYKAAYAPETSGRVDLEKLFNQLGTVFKPVHCGRIATMAQARIPPRPVKQDMQGRSHYNTSNKG